MKFVTFNTKSILVIFAILFTITLTFANSNAVESTIKTENNSQLKNKIKSNSVLKMKSQSKLTLKKKKYSLTAPPGGIKDLTEPLNIPLTQDYKSVTQPNPAQSSATQANPAQNSATQANPAQNSAKPTIPPKVGATKGTGDIIYNDWLKISSKGFRNHYNEIDMGYISDNIRIRLDSFDYRINDAYLKDDNAKNQPPNEELFWFRLSKDLVFYSSTKQDLNLLGGMKISEIVESEGEKKGEKGDYCFVITDAGNHDWQVCSEHENVRNMWYCKIQELRKETLPHYCSNVDNNNIKVIVKNVRKKLNLNL